MGLMIWKRQADEHSGPSKGQGGKKNHKTKEDHASDPIEAEARGNESHYVSKTKRSERGAKSKFDGIESPKATTSQQQCSTPGLPKVEVADEPDFGQEKFDWDPIGMSCGGGGGQEMQTAVVTLEEEWMRRLVSAHHG